MKLTTPCVCRGIMNAADFCAVRELLLGAADWNSNPMRQDVFEPHRETKSIIVRHTLMGYPTIVAHPWSPMLLPILDQLIMRFFGGGGLVVNALFTLLPAGARIYKHHDEGPYLETTHRIHVPIVSDNRVVFMIDNKRFNMQEGHLYEIDNSRKHAVYNGSHIDRIHLIFDYAEPRVIAARPDLYQRVAELLEEPTPRC